MKKILSDIKKQGSKRLVDDYANIDDFLDDILPTIKHWSEDLSEREYYTGDFPWREVRDDEEFVASVLYFFKDENEFLYSINGNVQTGHWRTLQSNKILIEKSMLQHKDSELYNLEFMNGDFMIMEKPGDQRSLGKSRYLVLAREHKVKITDWRSVMSQLSDDHKKGLGTILTAVILIAIVLILYFSWR